MSTTGTTADLLDDAKDVQNFLVRHFSCFKVDAHLQGVCSYFSIFLLVIEGLSEYMDTSRGTLTLNINQLGRHRKLWAVCCQREKWTAAAAFNPWPFNFAVQQ